MTTFRVTLSSQTYIEVDTDDLKDFFEDEHAEALIDNVSDEEFLDRLVEEYGFQYFIDEELYGSLREDEVYLDIEKL